MVETKINWIKVVDDVAFAAGPLPRVFGEMLSIARQAIVELADTNLCVATIHRNESRINITSPRSLSSKDLHDVIGQVAENLGLVADGTTALEELTFTVNGVPREKYMFDGLASKFNQQVVIPIYVQNAIIGLLYVASFDDGIDLKQSKILDHFSRHFARTLRHLWYLNIRQKETFERIVSRVFDGVILCGANKKITYLNSAAKRILKLDSEVNYVGQTIEALDVDYIRGYLEEAMTSGIFELNKVAKVAGSDSALVGVHLERLKNFRNSVLGWVIILRDVTKNWQNDQMRSTIALVGHEIKTPLSSILGAVDLLLEQDLGHLNDKQQQCLNVVKDDVSRLDRLLNDVLDLSRFDEGIQFLDRRREIALDFLVHKVIKSLDCFANSKNIEVENKIPKSLPTFRGNRDRLQQVLVNLIENSIKYSMPGTKVTVRAELVKTDLRLCVEDTGVGIPEEDLQRVFDRFVQLDNFPGESRHGYGLGLSIAKEIVEAVKGKIWVESELGVGSTFYVSLPT